MSASGVSDNGMIKIMGIVLGALCIFTLFCVVMARTLGIGDEQEDYLMRGAMLKRIAPVGQVRTSLAEAKESTAVAMAAPKTGEELVNGACASCHIAGVAGAPALTDADEWAARREAGLDALVASVVNGKGAMPAGGGSNYSEEEIRLAVQHIAGFAPADDDAAAVVSDSSSDTTAAAEATTEAATAAVSAGAASAVAELTDKVKTTVDGLCSACHISGAGGAPMLSDAAAWESRQANGMETLYTSVINGKGGMPAGGGSPLSPEELRAAVDYMLTKIE